MAREFPYSGEACFRTQFSLLYCTCVATYKGVSGRKVEDSLDVVGVDDELAVIITNLSSDTCTAQCIA